MTFPHFPFRKLYLIPQVFSASHIPQNTRGRHSAFRNPHSAKYSCPIPQVPRFFGTVLVRCWHTVTKTSLHFDWNCNLRLVFCRSLLNFTRFTYVFYVVLFLVYTKWVKWRYYVSGWRLAWIIYNHGTTEYRGIFRRYIPWRKISGTAQH